MLSPTYNPKPRVTRRHRNLVTALLVSIPILLANAAQATVIRMDFQNSSAAPDGGPTNATGVEPLAASANSVFSSDGSNIWNYLTIAPYTSGATFDPSFSDLVDTASGISTGVDLSFTGNISSAACPPCSPAGNATTNAVQSDYFFINSGVAGPNASYAITGLPADTAITMFVYSDNFAGRGFNLSANGSDATLIDSSASTAMMTVTSDGSGAITGLWSNIGPEGDWGGLQLSFSSAPEPASFGMIAGGLAALGLLRRKVYGQTAMPLFRRR